MKRVAWLKKLWQKVLYRAMCSLLLSAAVVAIGGQAFIHAAGTTSGEPAWSTPSSMAVRRVSALGSAQNQPNFLSNLDCSPLTYRMVDSSTMRTGCFTPTAFGMLDSDSETVIFNGTDEGLPLLPYSPHQVLAPWPAALNLITLDAADTGGSYIGLYKNPVADSQDQRNFAGQLTGKQLIAPPEISLKDPSGQRLVINPQTMAFSDGGSWLVVETLGGSFVRINLATLDMTAFAPTFGSLGSPALLKSQVAVSDDGRFVAVENTVADSFKVYDLSTCSGVVNNLRPQNCQSYDYWPFVNQRVGGLQAIRHVRFLNDGLLSFEATASNPAVSGVYELAPTASLDHLTDYIGLGDSYTSGEGAFDYLGGTDTDSNKCHLSSNSYPLLLTRDLFGAASGHSVACSGAVINDLASTSDNYRGQVKDGASLGELQAGQAGGLGNIEANFSPGYIAQHLFVKQYQPRVVTVSIGGNDIGFGGLLQNCVEPHLSRHVSDETCYNTYESRQEVVQLVDRTVPRWTALYKQLAAEDPGVQLYAIGYPSIAADTGSCGLNVSLGKSELEFAEELIHYLNGAIQQAASAAGVPYVDISQALDGHRLCEAVGYDVAVNGLTAGNDNGVFGINVLGRESYHPNALGHELIEQTILRQTANLTAAELAGPATNSSQDLLDAPKSGRPVNHVVPDDNMINPILHASSNAPLQIDGVLDGLKPSGAYAIRLDGPTGMVLTTATANANGDIAATVAVLADTASGGHTIDVTGTNQAGEPVDITQPVYVDDNGNDADGDGIADGADSCPYAMNSGQDADQDGIDDVCDPLIGPPPSKEMAGNQTPAGNDSPGSGDQNSSSDQNTTGSPPLMDPSTGNLQPATEGTSNNEEPEGVRASASHPTPPAMVLVTDRVTPRSIHLAAAKLSIKKLAGPAAATSRQHVLGWSMPPKPKRARIPSKRRSSAYYTIARLGMLIIVLIMACLIYVRRRQSYPHT